jgi:hypothetical protein
MDGTAPLRDIATASLCSPFSWLLSLRSTKLPSDLPWTVSTELLPRQTEAAPPIALRS